MTFKSLASETTYFLTVRQDDGTSKEYTRTAFGEWCETIIQNSRHGDELSRVHSKLAFQLEYMFQQAQLSE